MNLNFLVTEGKKECHAQLKSVSSVAMLLRASTLTVAVASAAKHFSDVMLCDMTLKHWSAQWAAKIPPFARSPLKREKDVKNVVYFVAILRE